jgi:hypothetical protein
MHLIRISLTLAPSFSIASQVRADEIGVARYFQLFGL